MEDDGGGSLTSLEGVAPSWTVGESTSVIFPSTIKSQRWLEKVRLLGKAEGVHDDLRADKLHKG